MKNYIDMPPFTLKASKIRVACVIFYGLSRVGMCGDLFYLLPFFS